jgi:hypothetical protein
MSTPALVTKELKSELPILIVDKVGILGEALAETVKQESLVILVSSKRIEDPNVIYIPYDNKIPSIPDNTYSHIFLIDEDGVLSKKIITPFLKKAEHDDSELILVVRKDMADREFAAKFLSSYKKNKLVVTGDIFAQNIIFDHRTRINKIIKQISTNKKIEVPGDGTFPTFPVFLEDVIWGVLQAGFIEKEDNVFTLYPKDHTFLSVSRMFQKIDPELKITFIDPEVKTLNTDEIEGKDILGEYNLESKIKKLELDKEFEEVKREEKDETFKFQVPGKINGVIAAVILTIILVLILPVFFTLTSLAGAGVFLELAKGQAEQGNLESSKNYVSTSYYLFSFSHASSTLMARESKILGLESKTNDLINKIEIGKEASHIAVRLFEDLGKVREIFLGQSEMSEEEFSEVVNDFKSTLVFYQEKKEEGIILASFGKNIDEIVSFSSATVESWPEILGFKGERKYLLLLQNNMELRPGGGFIGSFALATLNKGQLKSFKIYDVYDADGQLKGHIEPPFPIRRYMEMPNWFLRDSNFNVDFSSNALSSTVFLKEELNETVNSVIAVDLTFVRNLLSVIGEVKVLDYNEVVNSDNLYQVTQKRVEDNFFPGSTQKKNFLTSLYLAIQTKLSEDKTVPYLNLLQSMVTSVSEKNVMFAFNKKDTQGVFSVNGWGGTLFDSRQKDSGINDFIGVSEANFGGNKVNYYISRSTSLVSTVASNGEITNTFKISFKNNAPKNLAEKGLYKNYLRFILPEGVEVSRIDIDGRQQSIIEAITEPNLYEAENFRQPQGLEVYQTSEFGLTVMGFLVNVEPEALRDIVLTYKLKDRIDVNESSFKYSLKVYKQPGVDSIPFGLSINLPDNLTVVDHPEGATVKEPRASLAQNIVKDSEFLFTISKK